MHSVETPQLGESVSEAIIVRWIKGDGDRVEMDEGILELETDKAGVEIPAPITGVLHHTRAEGDTVRVGDVVGRIDPDAIAAAPDATVLPDAARPSPTAAPDSAEVLPVRREPAAVAPHALSPAVRRLVEEHRLDASRIVGSGRAGRIVKADVLRYLDNSTAPSPPQTATAPADVPLPAPEPAAEQRVPLSRMRRRIGERLMQAQREAAILTTFNEVDMSAVMALRSRFKEDFAAKHGVRLGFMSFFARACVAAMSDVPPINARIEGDEIVTPNAVHMGVAVGTKRGLVVPVVKHIERMTFAEIESSIGRLAELAQANRLSMDDLSGGTFTISNGGVYGSLLSTPILNPPQSAILGMHKIEKRPIVVDDAIVIRPMMYLALSYDHRLIDGAEAVTYLVRVVERLESPERLLFDL